MLALIVALAQAAPPTPYYETRELRLQVGPAAETDLRAEVGRLLKKNKLKLEGIGPEGPVPLKIMSRAKVKKPTVLALLLVMAHEAKGAEADVVIGVDESIVPVSLQWNDGVIRVEQGEPIGDLFVPGPDGEAMRTKFGIGPLVEIDRAWEPGARGLLAAALERLSPGELALLAGIPVHRKAVPTAEILAKTAPPDGSGTLAAVYGEDDTGARIEIYDAALQLSSRFVGSPADPRPASLHVLLHEIGHAVAAAPRRTLRAEYAAAIAEHGAIGERYNELVETRNMAASKGRWVDRMDAELDRLQKEGDALVKRADAIAAVLARQEMPAATTWGTVVKGDAPTLYGRSSVPEGFAECFALFHVDRAALQRTNPELVAWFESGEHVRISNEAHPE